jgi:hypothetical protein
MKNEIMNKGKRIDTNEWVFGYAVPNEECDKWYIILDVEADASYGEEETTLFATMWFEVVPETVSRYTGIHDKNSKEIYEGDRCIVTRPCVLATGQIKYIDGCPVFSEDKTGTLLTMLDLRLNGYEIKVVGSIHDDKKSLSQPSIDTE